MANQGLVPSNNQQHNVPALLEQGRDSLRALARAYFLTEVAGQAPATIDAKRRDLTRFFAFYTKLYGHERPEEWYASVTREFLKQTARAGVSEATLARVYASVRHFGRWIHFKVRPFPLGCPTEGIKPPREPEPEWKGLSRADELRLLAAAQTLRLRHGRGTNQALRDHAAIAVLLGSGLRISELLSLTRDQYTGRGFSRVIAKGGRIRDSVPVKAEARHVLEEWLAQRGDLAGAIFTTRSGAALTRTQFFKVLQRVAAQASAHLKDGERIKVSPHVLRHTFLRKLAEARGVHFAKEASGHRSDRYIWRYVKPNTESLADAIDALD
ncbi:MAG: tyrosine-type recombinase/integrase [Candidatus Binataceae bacterium]